MLNDIIEQFMKSKNMTNFDFSLRPNHDIANPFAKTSMDIIDRLQQSIEKADKSVLGDVLLDEADRKSTRLKMKDFFLKPDL